MEIRPITLTVPRYNDICTCPPLSSEHRELISENIRLNHRRNEIARLHGSVSDITRTIDDISQEIRRLSRLRSEKCGCTYRMNIYTDLVCRAYIDKCRSDT
jgi:hypothetical protein